MLFFFFKQKTAYEMRISDWSSDVCSSDLVAKIRWQAAVLEANGQSSSAFDLLARRVGSGDPDNVEAQAARRYWPLLMGEGFRRDRNADDINALLNYGYTVLRSLCERAVVASGLHPSIGVHRSEEHTSELQSLMRNSYAVFCLK